MVISLGFTRPLSFDTAIAARRNREPKNKQIVDYFRFSGNKSSCLRWRGQYIWPPSTTYREIVDKLLPLLTELITAVGFRLVVKLTLEKVSMYPERGPLLGRTTHLNTLFRSWIQFNNLDERECGDIIIKNNTSFEEIFQRINRHDRLNISRSPIPPCVLI